MSETLVTEDDVDAAICRKSLWEFVKYFWHDVIPEEPVWNWHIPYLCNELQKAVETLFDRKPKLYDLLINIPPGTTKSTLCSIMLPVWVWTRDKRIRTISGSYEHLLAVNFSSKSRRLVESEKYQRLFGPILLQDDQNTKTFYENEDGGDRKAVGTQGTVTGSHAHLLLIDDPINPKAARSEADLKAVNEWMAETLPSRKVDKEVSVTILIMQRLHEDDPSGKWIKLITKGSAIKHICLPATLSDDVKPAKLRARYIDGLLDPIRLSRAILKEQEALLGTYGYSGQYMQNPVPLGGGMFKTDRIKYGQLPMRWKIICRYWDKAGTEGAGAFTAGVKMGCDEQGRIWIANVKRGQLDSAEREDLIEKTAISDGKETIVGLEQEPGSGGKESAQNTAIRVSKHQRRVKINRPSGDKVLRADPFSVQVNQGNVYLPEGESWTDTYVEELKHFPLSTFKDQVDASSGAFTIVGPLKRVAGGLGANRKG